MAAGFTPRLRSRPLRFRLFSLALSRSRTLQTRSGALSRSNTASLVQETLSCQLDIRSPFLLDPSLLKVPVFKRMIQGSQYRLTQKPAPFTYCCCFCSEYSWAYYVLMQELQRKLSNYNLGLIIH